MERDADRQNEEGDAAVVSGEQMSLFPAGSAADASRDASAGREALDARFEELRSVAAALPASLRMGTSSWSFPGWRGIVYPGSATATQLAREGLRDYARHPLLRTVGIDRTFYAPVAADDWRRYADQLPDGFVCCIKAPGGVTSYTMPGGPVPQPNPDFLDAARMIDELIGPCQLHFARAHRAVRAPVSAAAAPRVARSRRPSPRCSTVFWTGCPARRSTRSSCGSARC